MFALDISADSSLLVSGSSDESLKLWDLNTWPPNKLFSMEEVHDLGKKRGKEINTPSSLLAK